jgi:hypothetical protein
MEFLAGILFTAFLLFLGTKVHLVKVEFGRFKEERTGGGTGGGSTPENPVNKK